MSVEIETEPVPSVKDLASSEPSIRRSCLKTITRQLEERSPSNSLTSTQCLQLWRGLYVALYMHDSKNAVSVQNLASEISKTVRIMVSKDDALRDTESTTWLQTWSLAFWETICREWSSIDQWRMNKILMLVRFVVREIFNVSISQASESDDGKIETSSSSSLLTSQTKIFEEWPLSPRERHVPDGLRLHVLDIWVDELSGQVDAVQKGIADDDESGETSAGKKSALVNEAAKKFMVPVEKISKEAISKGVKMRAKDALKRWQELSSS